jgi:hypothetical protein
VPVFSLFSSPGIAAPSSGSAVLRTALAVSYPVCRLAACPCGTNTAGAYRVPAAIGPNRIVDSIRAALNGPQREVFNALLELGRGGPAVFSRDEVAERLGWDAAGSHLRNRLSELAAMEIVDYPARGRVALQRWVR